MSFSKAEIKEMLGCCEEPAVTACLYKSSERYILPDLEESVAIVEKIAEQTTGLDPTNRNKLYALMSVLKAAKMRIPKQRIREPYFYGATFKCPHCGSSLSAELLSGFCSMCGHAITSEVGK